MKILDKLRQRGARRTFQRLYEYWLEKDITSAERIAALRDDEREGLEDLSEDEELTLREALQQQLPKPRETIQLRLPIRYVFWGLGFLAFLMVILAVITTILIMRSC